MTLAEARALVRGLMTRVGEPNSDGLNAAGHGGLKLGTELVTFQFEQARGVLISRSHLYEFRGQPAPGALERARAALQGTAGTVVYLPDAQLLALQREDSSPPSPEAFFEQVKALASAALTFADRL